MMGALRLRGVIPQMLTPFTREGDEDLGALREEIAPPCLPCGRGADPPRRDQVRRDPAGPVRRLAAESPHFSGGEAAERIREAMRAFGGAERAPSAAAGGP
jgi:hypothetical protein